MLSRWSGLSCEGQFELATKIAANVGYVIVQEPGIQAAEDRPAAPALDRAAVIEECAQIAANFETKRHWSDDPDMQNQAYYTEGEVTHEIATTIRAIAIAMQPTAPSDLCAYCDTDLSGNPDCEECGREQPSMDDSE
jgi:hypothetical protein